MYISIYTHITKPCPSRRVSHFINLRIHTYTSMHILPGLPLLLYTALALARDVLHYWTPLSVRVRVRGERRRRQRRGQEQNYQTEAKERIRNPGGREGLYAFGPR